MGLLDRLKLFVSTSFALLLLASSSLQISNGAPAAAGEFPFMVQLLIAVSSNGTHSTYANCGGSILSPDVVLTAAHCVHLHGELEARHGHRNGGEIHVIAGELWRHRRPNMPEPEHEAATHANQSRRQNRTQKATVRRIVIHEKYMKAFDGHAAEENAIASGVSLSSLLSPYDLALLHLDRRLHFNEFVQPVQLATCSNGEDSDDYTQCGQANLQVCGWGFETEDHQPYLLRKARLVYDPNQAQCFDRLHRRAGSKPEVSYDLTSHAHAHIPGDEISTLCVGDKDGSNVCKGDSGGPLICTVNGIKYVCGVASWALRGQCGVVGAPAVFTDVGRFREWILDEIRPRRAAKDIPSSTSRVKIISRSQGRGQGRSGNSRALTVTDSSKPAVFMVVVLSVLTCAIRMKLQ